MRGFTGTAPGYFSADNGAINLDSVNTSTGGDFGDWAASAGHDAFLAFTSASVINAISPADMTVLDVLGWTVIPRPDLSVSSLTVGPSGVGYTVVNTGSAVAAASTAAVYLSTDSSITTADILIGTGATPSLGLLASDPESAAFVLPTNLAVGAYFIGVIADGPDQVTEFNKNNNVSTVMPVILGNNDANTLTGNSGANLLIAMGGDDSLNGGAGADTMAGGLGDDHFVFADVVAGAGVDTIIDFSHAQSDKIDLSGVDANTSLGGDQAFVFIGASAFHDVAGELRFMVSGSNTTVMGDTNGDGVADFTLNLTGVTTLVSGDFLL